MNRVALITGGTRGIGFGIAKKLAKEGIGLALNGVRPETDVLDVLDELRKSGVRVEYFPGNIAETADREAIVSGVKEKFGTLNFLVNNAGVAPRVRADVLEMTEEDFDHLLDINLRGTFFLTQTIASWMAEIRNSDTESTLSIVNITSVSAVLASTNRAAYCMAKAGLSMMSKVMAIRMAEFDVPVYEIQPGLIETDMTEKVKGVYQERISKGLTLMPRMGTPADIGKVVAAILRGDMPYFTGQIITVDGGLTVERL